MVTLTVVILILITSSRALVIFRHSLAISTDTRTVMSINIRADVYQHLHCDENLVLLLLIFEFAQTFMVTRMSVLAL